MRNKDHHWQIMRYVRTPCLDCGTEDAISPKAWQVPHHTFMAPFKDKSIRTVCVDSIDNAEGAELLDKVLMDNGKIITYDIAEEAHKKLGKLSQYTFEKVGKFIVYTKTPSKGRGMRETFSKQIPKDKKTVLISRFGAFGDQLMCMPVIDYFKDQGYYVAYITSEKGGQALAGDVRIDDLIVQESDIVHITKLKEYMDEFKKIYDEVIWLNGAVEGSLLAVEGWKDGLYLKPWEWRAANLNHDYIDHHFKWGGIGNITGRPVNIYLTEEEKDWATRTVENTRRKLGKKKIYLLNPMGSGFHKAYPWTFDVIARVRERLPDLGFIAVGDKTTQYLIGAEWKDVVENMCGKLRFRRSLALHYAVDGVVSPETWSLTAGLAHPAPVVGILSHSAKGNFRFREQDRAVHVSPKNCPCYPCHQLHYSRIGCPVGILEKSATLCMDQLDPETVYKAIEETAYGDNPDNVVSSGTQIFRRSNSWNLVRR